MVASTLSRVFLDTNILVYALDNRDPVKQRRAQSLLTEYEPESFTISAQVLGEFYWTITRKLVPPLSAEAAQAAIDRLSSLVGGRP